MSITLIGVGLLIAAVSIAASTYGLSRASAASTCTQTFTPSSVGTNPYPGSSVNTAVHNAAAGAVLCFAAGSYGDIDLYGDHPSGMVTLQPASGAAVSMGTFNLNGVSNVTMTGFSGTSSSDGLIVQVSGQGNNSNITFSYNAMTSNGVTIANNALANANIDIAHNTFIGFGSSPEASRVNVVSDNSCPNGITIESNHMSGGQADGIDTSGGSCGTQIVHNEIDGIVETNCGGIHCDGFQDNGGGNGTVLAYNYFHGNSDCFLLDDGSSNINIHDNVCSTAANSSFWMQFGGSHTMTLNHNTITSTVGAQYGNDHTGSASSNVTFTNNVFYSTPALNPGQPVSGSFTETNNLCRSGCSGAHDMNGAPTFVDSAAASTYDGFGLTTTSMGHLAASDGTDVGIAAATVPPPTTTSTTPAPPPTTTTTTTPAPPPTTTTTTTPAPPPTTTTTTTPAPPPTTTTTTTPAPPPTTTTTTTPAPPPTTTTTTTPAPPPTTTTTTNAAPPANATTTTTTPAPPPTTTTTTAAPPANAIVPQAQAITLTSPAAGQTFNSSLTFAATATAAGSSVTRVEFWLDGKRVDSDSRAPYAYTWKVPSTISFGLHTAVVRAFAGSTPDGSAAVTVDRERSARSARAARAGTSAHTSLAPGLTIVKTSAAAGRAVTVTLGSCRHKTAPSVRLHLRTDASGAASGLRSQAGLCIIRLGS